MRRYYLKQAKVLELGGGTLGFIQHTSQLPFPPVGGAAAKRSGILTQGKSVSEEEAKQTNKENKQKDSCTLCFTLSSYQWPSTREAQESWYPSPQPHSKKKECKFCLSMSRPELRKALLHSRSYTRPRHVSLALGKFILRDVL